MRKRIKFGYIVSCMLVLLSLCGCGPKGYDEVSDAGVWRSLSDGEECGCYHRRGNWIYSGYFIGKPDDDRSYHPMQEIDVNTFMVCVGSDYAKDENYVFYPIESICEDGEYEDGTGWGGMYVRRYIVDGADPKSFKYLGNGYGIDRRQMYHDGEKIPWDYDVVKRTKEMSMSSENRF